jgi:NADPH:quinone reductase-like Zn-dependent oxidoreductase
LAHICARRPAPAAPRRCRIVVVRLRGDRIQRRLQAIRSLAGARPIPVVLDPTGGALESELLTQLSPGGTLIAYVQMASENISVPASAVVNAGVGCAV